MTEVTKTVDYPVLIIGAGVAGMTVATELADSGIKAILVERQLTAGGNALDLYRAFPTDDCFYCFEGNRWRPGIRKCFYRSALIDQPNLDLRIGTTVHSISGRPGQFLVTLRSAPQYVDPKKCTLCGVCIEVSKAFSFPSPQCQPQCVVFNPALEDDRAKEAAQKCPTNAIDLDAKPREDSLTVSDIVIAAGYHEMKPSSIDEYGYGRIPDVVTQLEFAKILDPNGPSGGAVVRPSDGKPARRVMMVQCVGSRDENHYPYCSKICCVFALKHAVVAARERDCSQVLVVYMDIRTYDRHERYYREARESGVDFIRGRVSRVEAGKDGGVDVTVYDSLLDRYLRFSLDLLVLSSALEPAEGFSDLLKMVGLSASRGYVTPLDIATEEEVVVGAGVYACGAALGPAEVPESVTQARAVVMKILAGRR
ncbi:MAG: CoB--CoM heterodisulfide reductase iron-sulfur subunit A family protein [Candidatus Thorarchaeota archaeon]|nr:CoB--CoM heterodisulfide reductase iron-sulfur subunit A family protein [Candidatus Thorarchaeota archaeon]